MPEKKKSSKQRGTNRLGGGEITTRLSKIPGWKTKERRGAIQRTYRLPDFRSALAFVAYVGELAESRSHHPDIDIRYNQVTLALSTHDAGGLTEKDFELAGLIDRVG